MSGKYAADTTVPAARSVQELERLVAKHGATGFGYGTDATEGKTRIVFRIADRVVRFEVGKPDPNEFRLTPTLRTRSLAQQEELAGQEERRRWRALVLVVKALLVAVSEGVISLSDAFLPYAVLPGGQTVGEWAGPQLDVIAATGQLPSPLPGGPPPHREIEGRAYRDGTPA